MRQRKHEREHKRQRGQYMTPEPLAWKIVSQLDISAGSRILEPSCGDGAFLKALFRYLASNGNGASVGLPTEITGIEIDSYLAKQASEVARNCASSLGLPLSCRIYNTDFFQSYLNSHVSPNGDRTTGDLRRRSFDFIVGNPPFGGTFNHDIEDILDASLGHRLGRKIKKETYAFFIVACLDLLRDHGRLMFVCSDTLLTIPTMTGLRQFLMEHGEVSLTEICEFSPETTYPMLVLDFFKGGKKGFVAHNDKVIGETAIRATPNLSWGITPELEKLFDGPLLSEFFVASSGMTTGKNEYFVRKITHLGEIEEPYEFEFFEAPITLKHELERARLGKLSTGRKNQLMEAEACGRTERRVNVIRHPSPTIIPVPDNRYKPYNKANGRIIFSHPDYYIFWENDGDAVLTYKKTGNWYLRGVGGQPYFGRECITWQLISSRFTPRFLPEGYILDSGAPCAFLRDNIHRDELFFVLAWLLSPLANQVLKTVINHTRNIQSKDFERMPYPWWVPQHRKSEAVSSMKNMIGEARAGRKWTWKDSEVRHIGHFFEVRLNERLVGPFLKQVAQVATTSQTSLLSLP